MLDRDRVRHLENGNKRWKAKGRQRRAGTSSNLNSTRTTDEKQWRSSTSLRLQSGWGLISDAPPPSAIPSRFSCSPQRSALATHPPRTTTYSLRACSPQMVAFVLLLMPMPLRMRRSIFTFITTSSLVAKFAYGLKISFMYVSPAHELTCTILIHKPFLASLGCCLLMPYNGCCGSQQSRKRLSSSKEESRMSVWKPTLPLVNSMRSAIPT